MVNHETIRFQEQSTTVSDDEFLPLQIDGDRDKEHEGQLLKADVTNPQQENKSDKNERPSTITIPTMYTPSGEVLTIGKDDTFATGLTLNGLELFMRVGGLSFEKPKDPQTPTRGQSKVIDIVELPRKKPTSIKTQGNRRSAA